MAKKAAASKSKKSAVKKSAVAKKAKPAPKKKAAPKAKKKAAPKTKKPVARPVKKTKAAAKSAPKKIKKVVKKAAVKPKAVKKLVKPVKAKVQPKVAKPVKAKARPKAKAKKIVQAPPPAPVKTRTEPLKKYSKAELEEFKQIIEAKLNHSLENLQTLRDHMLDPSTGEYINENSPYSLHMAEQGTDAMEKEKTYFWAQREQKFLGYLEEALKRIELGTYGLCTECIEEPKHLCPTCPLIPKERLIAVPHSQLCAQIKKLQEKPRRI